MGKYDAGRGGNARGKEKKERRPWMPEWGGFALVMADLKKCVVS